jgi:hypothetical protein
MAMLRRTFDRVFGGAHASTAHLVDEIKRLQYLRQGWNSHRAPAISDAAIKAALEVVEVLARKHLPLPSAAPTPLGGVALVWELGDIEAQVLVDEQSYDYSVGRRAHPKVVDEGSSVGVGELERRFIDRYLHQPA